MRKQVRIITLILGILILLFGIKKFFEPSKTKMFDQILLSELPFTEFTYWLGIIGELATGLTFIFLVIYSKKLSSHLINIIFYIGHLSFLIIMLVATYVHLHPAVPAEIVPLGKTPVFPAIFILALLINIYLMKK